MLPRDLDPGQTGAFRSPDIDQYNSTGAGPVFHAKICRAELQAPLYTD
jgi:hypothetical protein